MIKKRIILVLLGCIVAISGCSQSVLPEGAFHYTAYDQNGTDVVEGQLMLIRNDTQSFEGTWNFSALGEPQNIGPQVGEGRLTGSLQGDDTIAIALNPDMADNNVALVGTYSRNDIVGIWQWSTIIGVTNQGTFQARK